MKYVLILVFSLMTNDGVDVEVKQLDDRYTEGMCARAAAAAERYLPRKNQWKPRIGIKVDAMCVLASDQ